MTPRYLSACCPVQTPARGNYSDSRARNEGNSTKRGKFALNGTGKCLQSAGTDSLSIGAYRSNQLANQPVHALATGITTLSGLPVEIHGFGFLRRPVLEEHIQCHLLLCWCLPHLFCLHIRPLIRRRLPR